MKLEQYLKQKGRIYLGNPLDLLLNDECKIEVYEKYCNDRIKNKENFEIDDEIKDKVKIGGILLPTGEDIGTGNIIIRGRPGTGKSTLAMQIAITCAQKPNNYLSAYISLEERAEHLITKAKEFNWNDYILSLEYLHNLDKFAGPEDYAELLRNVFKNNNSGDKNPSPS
ncbi:MAG: ATPase domain-containing protein, partial [Promethearchaeota archaeon]